MSGEAERAAAIRAEHEAELREQIEAALSDALDHHGHEFDSSRCECGYREPYGLSIGEHQIRMQAAAVFDLIRGRL